MGFKVEKTSDNSCVILAVPGEADATQFLTSAQTALKNLWIDITVDMTARPYALGAILPHLSKLQQVLSSHNRKIVAKGVKGKVSAEFVNRLEAMGIEVIDDAVPMSILRPVDGGPPDLQSVIIPKVAIPVEPVVQPLPPAEELTARFTELKDRLALALRRRRFLERERQTYKDRLKVLMKGRGDAHVDNDQIQKIAELETKLVQLKNDRNLLQKDVHDTTVARKEKEGEFKRILVDGKSEEKRRRESIEKQLAELTSKHEKVKAEFKKKSDMRKEKLMRAVK